MARILSPDDVEAIMANQAAQGEEQQAEGQPAEEQAPPQADVSQD
jgi:hypothetical protein